MTKKSRKKYHFYYDESGHDKKITENAISRQEYFDNFVVAIVGWSDEGIPEVRRETSPEFQIAGKLRHHDQGGGGEAGRPDLLREGQNHQPCGDLYRKRAGGPRQQSKDGNQDFQRILPHAVQGGAGTVRLR